MTKSYVEQRCSVCAEPPVAKTGLCVECNGIFTKSERRVYAAQHALNAKVVRAYNALGRWPRLGKLYENELLGMNVVRDYIYQVATTGKKQFKLTPEKSISSVEELVELASREHGHNILLKQCREWQMNGMLSKRYVSPLATFYLHESEEQSSRWRRVVDDYRIYGCAKQPHLTDLTADEIADYAVTCYIFGCQRIDYDDMVWEAHMRILCSYGVQAPKRDGMRALTIRRAVEQHPKLHLELRQAQLMVFQELLAEVDKLQGPFSHLIRNLETLKRVRDKKPDIF
jgi:hypothetical protein